MSWMRQPCSRPIGQVCQKIVGSLCDTQDCTSTSWLEATWSGQNAIVDTGTAIPNVEHLPPARLAQVLAVTTLAS